MRLSVITAAVLSLVAVSCFFYAARASIWRWIWSIIISTGVVSWSLARKSLNIEGAAWAFVVGFTLTFSNLTFCVMLLTFFVTSSRLTKWRSQDKSKLDQESAEGLINNV
jgi:uncharacterized membrane protein